MTCEIRSCCQKDEGGIDKELVSQWIEEFSEVGDEIPASCDMAINGIRDGTDDKDDTAKKVNPVKSEMKSAYDEFRCKNIGRWNEG